jgi:hypothetical protein
MITIDKYQVFKKYSQNSDAFAKLASRTEKEIFDSNDWQIIESFIQDIELVKKELVSLEYKTIILKKIKSETDLSTFSILTKDIK